MVYLDIWTPSIFCLFSESLDLLYICMYVCIYSWSTYTFHCLSPSLGCTSMAARCTTEMKACGALCLLPVCHDVQFHHTREWWAAVSLWQAVGLGQPGREGGGTHEGRSQGHAPVNTQHTWLHRADAVRGRCNLMVLCSGKNWCGNCSWCGCL